MCKHLVGPILIHVSVYFTYLMIAVQIFVPIYIYIYIYIYNTPITVAARSKA
jgi:hypothetical protein